MYTLSGAKRTLERGTMLNLKNLNPEGCIKIYESSIDRKIGTIRRGMRASPEKFIRSHQVLLFGSFLLPIESRIGGRGEANDEVRSRVILI